MKFDHLKHYTAAGNISGNLELRWDEIDYPIWSHITIYYEKRVPFSFKGFFKLQGKS